MTLLKTLSTALLLVLAVAAATATPPPQLPSVMRTAHFVVHYDPGDPFLAKLMADAAEDELGRVSRDLGWKPARGKPFPLYVYPTHIGFIRAGGLETRKFTVGTATAGSDVISVDASGAFALPQEVLAHEITHAVISRILSDRVVDLPLWVNEGLAQYESDEMTSDDRAAIAEAAADGTLIPLPDLARTFPEQRTSLAYAESASAVRYMVKHHGEHSPRVLLRELARAGSLDKAMLAATGKNTDQFTSDWYSHTTRSYWALRVARIGAAIVGALMAVLVVAAFIARRRAMARAAKQWEEEEQWWVSGDGR